MSKLLRLLPRTLVVVNEHPRVRALALLAAKVLAKVALQPRVVISAQAPRALIAPRIALRREARRPMEVVPHRISDALSSTLLAA